MQIPARLVMGATGRLGQMLRRHWGEEAARWSARRSDRGDDRCDPLTEPGVLAGQAKGVQALLCLAGVVPGSGGDWEDNTRLALAAMTAAEAAGAHVYLTSSAAVYGRAGGVLSEEAALAPDSPYGVAKARMEAAAQARAAQTGQRLTILRIGNVAGADAILGGWRPGFTLDRFADGTTPVRSYIGPACLAGVLDGLCARRDLPQVLNIAQPAPVEMGALLDAANLAWTARPAPDSAIARVELATSRLNGVLPVPPASAHGLVGEWQADQR